MTRNRDLIHEHETAFARALSRVVVEKPKLSIWMILIPVIMVYHFMRLDRYRQGRREFTENYMISRDRALNAAEEAVSSAVEPDPVRLAEQSDVPEQARQAHARLTGALVEHYRRLLRADGADWDERVRHGYGDKSTYLLLLNRLTQLEKELNGAIRPQMSDKIEGFDEIVRDLEAETERLRRIEADRIFS